MIGVFCFVQCAETLRRQSRHTATARQKGGHRTQHKWTRTEDRRNGRRTTDADPPRCWRGRESNGARRELGTTFGYRLSGSGQRCGWTDANRGAAWGQGVKVGFRDAGDHMRDRTAAITSPSGYRTAVGCGCSDPCCGTVRRCCGTTWRSYLASWTDRLNGGGGGRR